MMATTTQHTTADLRQTRGVNYCTGHALCEVPAPYSSSEEYCDDTMVLVCVTCTQRFADVYDQPEGGADIPFALLSVEELREFFCRNGHGGVPDYIAEFSLGPGMPPRERWVVASFMDDFIGASCMMAEYGCMLCHEGPAQAVEAEPDYLKRWSVAALITVPGLCDTDKELEDAAYVDIDDSDQFRVCVCCIQRHMMYLVDRDGTQTAVVVDYQDLKPEWRSAVDRVCL